MKNITLPVVTLLLTLLAGCARSGENRTLASVNTDTLEPHVCGAIKRLHTYQGAYLASQPGPDDFALAKKEGVRTVINLRHPGEIKEFDEEAVVMELGLTYYNPAWNGPDELTDAVFDEVRLLLKETERPILLHCGSANRVGAVWMAHRALDGGLTVEAALAEAKIVGLKTEAYEDKARAYIAAKKSGNRE